MAFMSTVVTAGSGIGLVTETGMKTEVGQIADLMKNAEKIKTPMQQRIEKLSKTLIIIAVIAVFFVIGFGIYIGENWIEMVQTGISLAVAAIPEGLPTIVTIVLTVGARKMSKSHALVRQLGSVETLGSTTVICSDKTGTLTQNQMQVVEYWSGNKNFKVTGKGFDPIGDFITDEGKTANIVEYSELKHGLIISALCNAGGFNQSGDSISYFGTPMKRH